MSSLDWLVVALYFLYILSVGLNRRREKDSLVGYFLADRSFPWWMAGLSVIATQMSAITLIGGTGKAFEDGLRFIQFYFGLPFAMVVLCVTLLPLYASGKVLTAYELLEQRFDARTRMVASVVFLLSRGLSCGVIIAAPAVVLTEVLQLDLLSVVALIGAVTTLYTMYGGVAAVTRTDARQMGIILFGLGFCFLAILLRLPEGVGTMDMLSFAGRSGFLTSVDLSFDPGETYTFWSGCIGGFFLMLSYFGCDQSQVQRYLSAKSLRHSRLSLLCTAVVKIPLQLVVLMLGVMIFVLYQIHPSPLVFGNAFRTELSAEENPQFSAMEQEYAGLQQQSRSAALRFLKADTEQERDESYRLFSEQRVSLGTLRTEAKSFIAKSRGEASFSDVNYVFPRFILEFLPGGLLGLLVVAILAAAMSSISSELNSLATISVIDVYRRYLAPEKEEHHYFAASRLTCLFWGIFATIVAYYASNLGALIEVVNTFGSYFYGSLLGVFLLAYFAPQVGARAAFWGLISGVCGIAIVDQRALLAALAGVPELADFELSFLWYNLLGVLFVCSAAWLISLFSRRPAR